MDENVNSLASAIRAFISRRLAAKLEVFEKTAGKQRDGASTLQLAEIEDERNKIIDQFEPIDWLTSAARRARRINLVTHAPKYTHSGTSGTGALITAYDSHQPASERIYLDSYSLRNPTVDVTGHSAALDVAALLQVEYAGKSLLDEVVAGDSPALSAFSNDDSQVQEWIQGLSQAMVAKDVSSGQLSKQVYFPVDDGYHVLSPLYASSLSQSVYQRLNESFFSEEAQARRKARRTQRHYPGDLVNFPNVAKQVFGGSNAQNISQLNAKRRGLGYMLPSLPPRWNSRVPVPTSGPRAFWLSYERIARETARQLQEYLESVFLHPSNREHRSIRAGLVDELAGLLLSHAAQIQRQKESRGWSAQSALPMAEQLWLDPYRGELDPGFKAERDKSSWQGAIAEQFAEWLNRKLNYGSLHLQTGDAERREWEKLLQRKLATLKDDLEATA